MMAQTSISQKNQMVQLARQILQNDPLYLDTETTGVDAQDEIVEISIVNDQGVILYQSLIKPTQPIPLDTRRIHGISNEMVVAAPAWPMAWAQIRPILLNRLIVAYNAEFDQRMMKQSHKRYSMPWRDVLNFHDLMKTYAQFYGEWDANRRSWRYQSLEKAGQQCGISLPNTHRATADTLLTRALLHYISNSA